MIPRILVAGTHSGCGKTTLASALMAALTRRGLIVQPFKVGPDFIDPSHHTNICHRFSRNLDPYMMGEDGVRQTFTEAAKGADVAVIEGVMGLYDGLDATDECSSAHVAKILACPVILTVDVKGMSRSAHAIVQGYRSFDPAIRFSGVLFNRVGSPRHRSMIEQGLTCEALGWIPFERDRTIDSRHLGLKMAHEYSGLGDFAAVLEEHADVDRIVAIAKSAPDVLPEAEGGAGRPATAETKRNGKEKITVAVAHDPPFCFYYQDNFNRLRRFGVTLTFFSPLADGLPPCDALYLGGGYPELYADSLSAAPARDQICRAAEDGLPIYAECGGLTYLTESLHYEGTTYPMAGVLPAHAVKQDRFQALGYVDARVSATDTLLPSGLSYRGHEFHYTALECDDDARFALTLARGKGIDDGKDGLMEHNVLAGYTHAYMKDEFVQAFTEKIRAHSRR